MFLPVLWAAQAAVALQPPEGEAPEAWAAVAELAGFELGVVGDGPGARLVAGVDAWTLLVTDERGVVRVVRVPPPQSRRDREDLVWIAQSLLVPAEPPGVPGPAPLEARAPAEPRGARQDAAVLPERSGAAIVASPPSPAPPPSAPRVVSAPPPSPPMESAPPVVSAPPPAAPAPPTTSPSEASDRRPPGASEAPGSPASADGEVPSPAVGAQAGEPPPVGEGPPLVSAPPAPREPVRIEGEGAAGVGLRQGARPAARVEVAIGARVGAWQAQVRGGLQAASSLAVEVTPTPAASHLSVGVDAGWLPPARVAPTVGIGVGVTRYRLTQGEAEAAFWTAGVSALAGLAVTVAPAVRATLRARGVVDTRALALRVEGAEAGGWSSWSLESSLGVCIVPARLGR